MKTKLQFNKEGILRRKRINRKPKYNDSRYYNLISSILYLASSLN